ncbi:MAG: FeS-binding protein, partial [Desulfovibrio sp.]
MRTERRPLFGFLFRLLWRISVVWAVASGFAHLPVIYRYAEEALPWLRPAAYSGTVAHYWAAAAMLCLTSYAAIVWLVRGTRSYSLTPFGMLRLVLLALLMLSGLGLILHNFQDFSFYGPVYTLIKH